MSRVRFFFFFLNVLFLSGVSATCAMLRDVKASALISVAVATPERREPSIYHISYQAQKERETNGCPP